MRLNSKVPKTFSIYVTKGSKSGYLKYKSHDDLNLGIIYTVILVKNINDASKFVNFNNVKEKAILYAEKYHLDEVKIVDDKIMKYYYVKKKQEKK